MTAASRPWAREILRMWFHDLRPRDWYGGGEALDRALRRKFGDLWAMLRALPPAHFLDDRPTALAAILLFDQIPRNIHRGSRKSFATDPLARSLSHAVIERGWLPAYNRRERQFALMPLMHSERISDQRLSLELFAHHAPGVSPFARSHWRMIARFGRFPHRNEVLGRSTTAKEQRAIDAGFSW